MPVSDLDYREHDRRFWEEELDEFVPERVFDAHFHLFVNEHLDDSRRTEESKNFEIADSTWSDGTEWANTVYPGRETHFLVLPMPLPGIDVDAHNQWLADQIKIDPGSRANRLVTPDCRVEDIERDMKSMPQVVGFKPYRFFSVTGEIAQCRIHEFLPHEQMELANELGLWVTMHLSRYQGCADAHNLRDLAEYTGRRYPKIKWILAHCARSFTYWPIRQAVERLRDMPNIWYDLSAVTDIRPFITLFQKEDLSRLMYGSDGICACSFHGQYVALGRAWQGLQTDRIELRFPHCDGRPIISLYEQLLSMKHAAEIAGLSRDDIEAIFWRNACDAFDLDSAAGADRVASRAVC